MELFLIPRATVLSRLHYLTPSSLKYKYKHKYKYKSTSLIFYHCQCMIAIHIDKTLHCFTELSASAFGCALCNVRWRICIILTKLCPPWHHHGTTTSTPKTTSIFTNCPFMPKITITAEDDIYNIVARNLIYQI